MGIDKAKMGVSRRAALQRAGLFGIFASLPATSVAGEASLAEFVAKQGELSRQDETQDSEARPKLSDEEIERLNSDEVQKDLVKGVGMTDAEADCWLAAAKVAGLFFELPELHPMDQQEIASAVHIIQNKLLSRPTYREYLAAAKRAYGDREK